MPPMPNPNPYRARQARKRNAVRRRRKPGTLQDARGQLWQAMHALDEAIRSNYTDVAAAEDMDEAERRAAMLTRCTHALAQAAAVYERLTESTEHEARLAELERQAGIVSPWVTSMPAA